jgi:hypothetical protein
MDNNMNIPDIVEMYNYYIDRYAAYSNLGFEDVQCAEFALSAVMHKHNIVKSDDNKILILSEFHAMNCANLIKQISG